MKLLEFTMTGTAHSAGYKANKLDIKEGDGLELERDPSNAYDTAAIKILWNGAQIGWVPKRLAEAKVMLDALLAWDTDVIGIECSVAMHSPDNPVDMQLQVLIELKEFV
jgi:HIRAN domain